MAKIRIPIKYALHLAKTRELKTFIETGTHVGQSAAWAARQFRYVYTIELMQEYTDRARAKNLGLRNITYLVGDSRSQLPVALSMMEGPGLFWLDAHWSPDLQWKRNDLIQCPLLDELRIIMDDPRDNVVMIDDARLFSPSAELPRGYRAADWPRFRDIEDLMESEYTVALHGDCLVCARMDYAYQMEPVS